MATPRPGYLSLHPNRSLNFLMNRLRSTIPPGELIEVGRNIETLEDWVREMLAAGRQAETDGRLLEAANYYRGAEFYMVEGQAGKEEAYNRFLALHDQVLPEVARQRDAVPYGAGSLPAIVVPAEGEERGVILIHSGFDGLVEEVYPRQLPLAQAGYRLVMFDGLGQGAALRHSGLHMPADWEKPVGAILDHYGIDSCTLVGMSLGGYLAPRAAAFDERITRLVVWGAMFDFLACIGSGFGQDQFERLKQLVNNGERDSVNSMLESAMAANEAAAWAFRHGMHVCGAEDPFGFVKWAATLSLRDVSDRIHQDVLIVMGSQDHLVPLEQFYRLTEALVSARSVTARLMTEKEHGAQHCQVGNPQIVTDEILSWLDLLDKRDSRLQDLEPDISFDTVSTISDKVREVCLGLADTNEKVSHGFPVYTVRSKQFATYAVNHHGDGKVALLLNASLETQNMLVNSAPRHFFVPPYIGSKGWVGVELNQGLSWTRISQLVHDAYVRTAPAALANGSVPVVVEPPTEEMTAEDIDPLMSAANQAILQRLREISLVLPESSEHRQFGNPCFKAGKKTFCTLHHRNGDPQLQIWVGADRQVSLTAFDRRYVIPAFVGRHGWIDLELSGQRNWQEISELILDSYRHFALKRMLKDLDA